MIKPYVKAIDEHVDGLVDHAAAAVAGVEGMVGQGLGVAGVEAKKSD